MSLLVGLILLWFQLSIRGAQGHHYAFLLKIACLRLMAKPLPLTSTTNKRSLPVPS